MSNNLFNSKNLWIDYSTARILGIDTNKEVYVNGERVSVNDFYQDSIEFSLPLFVLRTEKLYELISKKDEDAATFRVFSNLEENISRLFTNEFDSIKLFSDANIILEEQGTMNDEERSEIFLSNNEQKEESISKSKYKKIKKLVEKRKNIEAKIKNLEFKLKKELFNSMNSLTIESTVQDDFDKQIDTNVIDIPAKESKKNKSKKNNKHKVIEENNNNNDSLIVQENINNTKSVIRNLENSEKIIETKLDMAVEEERIEVSAVEIENEEYKSLVIEEISREFYSKEALKIEKKILKNKKNAKKIINKISSINNLETKTPDEFIDTYNNILKEFEDIKTKMKISEKMSSQEFNKIKPFILAEYQKLIFSCYKTMNEAKFFLDDSLEMFAKLILLMKKKLLVFDNK